MFHYYHRCRFDPESCRRRRRRRTEWDVAAWDGFGRSISACVPVAAAAAAVRSCHDHGWCWSSQTLFLLVDVVVVSLVRTAAAMMHHSKMDNDVQCSDVCVVVWNSDPGDSFGRMRNTRGGGVLVLKPHQCRVVAEAAGSECPPRVMMKDGRCDLPSWFDLALLS